MRKVHSSNPEMVKNIAYLSIFSFSPYWDSQTMERILIKEPAKLINYLVGKFMTLATLAWHAI